jgi:hypothetical protein
VYPPHTPAYLGEGDGETGSRHIGEAYRDVLTVCANCRVYKGEATLWHEALFGIFSKEIDFAGSYANTGIGFRRDLQFQQSLRGEGRNGSLFACGVYSGEVVDSRFEGAWQGASQAACIF